LTTWLTSSYFS